jgi:hypothetical protein
MWFSTAGTNNNKKTPDKTRKLAFSAWLIGTLILFIV